MLFNAFSRAPFGGETRFFWQPAAVSSIGMNCLTHYDKQQLVSWLTKQAANEDYTKHGSRLACRALSDGMTVFGSHPPASWYAMLQYASFVCGAGGSGWGSVFQPNAPHNQGLHQEIHLVLFRADLRKSLWSRKVTTGSQALFRTEHKQRERHPMACTHQLIHPRKLQLIFIADLSREIYELINVCSRMTKERNWVG